MRWLLWSTVAGAFLGVAVFEAGIAGAEPAQPGPTTSSSDELADMVLDVVEHGVVTAPTTTPVPAPPR